MKYMECYYKEDFVYYKLLIISNKLLKIIWKIKKCENIWELCGCDCCLKFVIVRLIYWKYGNCVKICC